MKKRHLLACGPWYPATAFNYFVEAFERLGWEVTRVGPKYFDHGKEYSVQWDQDLLPKVDIERRRGCDWRVDSYVDMATHNKQNPVDLVFICEENYANNIRNTTKVPSILWSADGWQNSFNRREMIQPTIAYTNHPFGVIPQRQKQMPEGWEFMPAAAAPWIHQNKFKPLAEREIDFCLLATPYGMRPQLCEALRFAGLKVKDGIVGTREFVESYNNSKLTYHNANTQDEWKWRFGEASGAGTVNIADFTKIYSWLGFQPFFHYLPIDIDPVTHWPDPDNFVQVVKEALSNPELLQSISTAAWYLTVSNHSYYNRYYTILTALGIDPQISLSEIRNLSLRENGDLA